MALLTVKVESELLAALDQLTTRSTARSRGELVRRALWRLVREGIRAGRLDAGDGQAGRLKPRRSRRKMRSRSWEVVIHDPAA